MKIYTKGGDLGETSLLGGTRVSKADMRIESYGTVDELNCFIGLLISHFSPKADFLQTIQHKLFNIGSILALEKGKDFSLPSVDDSDIKILENEIDAYHEHLPELKNFILPGGSMAAGYAHVARSVCRRAERRVVALQDDHLDVIVKYLNRLSDYFFVLSREILFVEHKQEVHWKK